ncbi:amino acid ABC transporter permease [Devosia nitrariae]|uniref:Amino acid ABC transporter permease n=1 Tax=Devosia nitrariae TaxID=2071872 RepID=A0ABQ5WC27_9HYPH|nr:amino acid ABC transporter permease [Devosia nitrariae]GLQ57695.1 amino acid ABC transporter permease [Devosia nitrariae]
MSLTYVREQMVPAQPPPVSTAGVVGWMRKNLFATPFDTIMTIIGIAFLIWAVPPIYGFIAPNFLGGDAVAPGGTVEDCRAAGAGACWAYISARMSFFIYGFYPPAEYWRPNLVFFLGAVLIVPLLWPAAPFKRTNAVLFFVVYPVVCYYLLNGGVFGMRRVPTEQWGGLLVTLIISLVGIICSIPIGILLALGRQSKLPIIRTLSVMFIELWRAVPLITVLFMASIMLPLFMPQGTTVDKLLRALVGVTLFSSAYLAEVVRGGLQALPRGQYEAASSLGLSYWKSMAFIILPQALKHVIPGIVNSFIALFKDTSLVSIVGIFDLLNTVQAASSDINWSSPTQAVTGYLFAAFMFWIFCFAMSRYSIWMERRLDTGHKG